MRRPKPGMSGAEYMRATRWDREAPKRAKALAIARSIWPTGKPGPQPWSAEWLRAGVEWEVRTRGIAEGRRLARARMERFVAWLRSEGLTGLAMLSSAHLSPLAATMESIEAGCRWPFKAAGIAWDEAWLREARDACDFALMGRRVLASPEWAALPWQREAGR